MIYLLLLLCSASLWTARSEFRACECDVPSSNDSGFRYDEVRYIPATTFNPWGFIQDRLKKSDTLFKKYPELGNNTIENYLEKNTENNLSDLKTKFLNAKIERATAYKYMIRNQNDAENHLGALPPELQLNVLKFVHKKLFEDISLMDYKNLERTKPANPS